MGELSVVSRDSQAARAGGAAITENIRSGVRKRRVGEEGVHGNQNTVRVMLIPWLTPCLILQALARPVRVIPVSLPCSPYPWAFSNPWSCLP